MNQLRDPERRGRLLLLAPYLLGLAVLVIVPTAVAVGLAFFEYDLIRPPVFVGFDNLAGLLRDDVFRVALRNSLGFVVLAVPLRLLGALALALLLHRRFAGVGFHRAAALVPTIIPDAAYAIAWLWLLNPIYGPVNLLLGSLGLPEPSWLTHPAAAQWAIVIMSVFQIGEGFLVALVARQLIRPELYELAETEGAGGVFVFLRVTLPLMAPTLLLLMFRDTVYSFQVNFVPAFLVTNGGPPPYSTTYLPLFIYETGFEFLRYGYAAAATLAMFGVTVLIIYLQWRVVDRWRSRLLV